MDVVQKKKIEWVEPDHEYVQESGDFEQYYETDQRKDNAES